jgi:acetyl-CoA acetyltransferase
MTDVVIAGVGMHPFGRYPDKDPEDIAIEAISKALEDADMTYKDMQFALCGKVAFKKAGTGIDLMMKMGMTGIPIYQINAMCATGGAMLKLARDAINSGSCEIVLVYGFDKHKGMFDELGEPWQNILGMKASPIAFATVAQKYMNDYGATEEDFARVAVKAHKNGANNPYALFRNIITVEDVLKSPMVAYPLHLYNFCTPDDGAAAAIVCSEKAAKKFGIKQPIKIAATVMQTAQYPPSVVEPANQYSVDIGKGLGTPVTELAARKAYEMAGVGPGDIDVCEVQDTESAHELVHVEQLGLCKRGEAYKLLREGVFDITGRLPVNPSGGIQCKGEPPGASGLGQVCEIVWQMRKQAGARQISKDPKIGLCQVFGWNHVAAVTILKK